MSMYEPLVWSRSGYRASLYDTLFSSLSFWSLGVVVVPEFDRFRDRLDEDFFRARRRRSIVKSVVEVSSGQSCSFGQRLSFAQKATRSVGLWAPLLIAGSLNASPVERGGDVRCRFGFGSGSGLASSACSIGCLRLRPLLWTGAGGSWRSEVNF